MDDLDNYRQIIEQVLSDYAQLPYSYGDIAREIVFDRHRDRYVLLSVGWENNRRVHGSLVHIDIINGKLWIQRDGTEQGIATDLLEAGVPKDRIVLAFRPPEIRKYTEFAVA